MKAHFLGQPATRINVTATRQPAHTRMGTYIGLELQQYPMSAYTLMSIESARELLMELHAAIAAAETLQAEQEPAA